MGKTFRMMGLFALGAVCFFYTDKIIKEITIDENLMMTIKLAAEKNEVKVVEASVSATEFIPGLSGMTVDIDASYKAMKKLDSYDTNRLVYNIIMPQELIDNNYDKYITSGNKSLKNISIIFLVEEDTDISLIYDKVKAQTIDVNYFIDTAWLKENSLDQLLTDNVVIGNLGTNGDYRKSDFIWLDNIIKNKSTQERRYCFTKEENKTIVEYCARQKNHIIKANPIAKNFLINVQEQLQNGSILVFNINRNLSEEIDYLIKHIQTKGYVIKSLDELLSSTHFVTK